MIFKYLYPILIKKDSFVKESFSTQIYVVIENFYAFFIDYDSIRKEIGSQYAHDLYQDMDDEIIQVEGIVHGNSIDIPSIPVLYTFRSKQIIEVNTSMEMVNQMGSILEKGCDRYFNVSDRYYHTYKDTVEEIGDAENAIKLPPNYSTLLHTSPFENIYITTISKGTVLYDDDEDEKIEVIKDVSCFFHIDWLTDPQNHGLYTMHDNIPFIFMSEDDHVSALHFDRDNVVPTTKQCKSIEDTFSVEEGEYREYQFGNYTIHVKEGYTRIISTYVITLFKKLPIAYKDILILF